MGETLNIALQILALGWGRIFLVMFIIYLVSLVLSRMFPPESE